MLLEERLKDDAADVACMLNPKATALVAGCGCCCASVKHLDGICQAVCLTAWRYKYEKNNHFLVYLH